MVNLDGDDWFIDSNVLNYLAKFTKMNNVGLRMETVRFGIKVYKQ